MVKKSGESGVKDRKWNIVLTYIVIFLKVESSYLVSLCFH